MSPFIRSSSRRRCLRSGNILPLAAVLMVAMLGMVAFSVDIGYLALTRTQMQAAADSAALAAAQQLNPLANQATVAAAARTAATQVAQEYQITNSAFSVDSAADVEFGRRIWNATKQTYDIAWGDSATPYNLARVYARKQQRNLMVNGVSTPTDTRVPLFFAPVLGDNHGTLQTVAVATFQPRDIMLCLDFSGSMTYDSIISAMPELGVSAIYNNIQTMYSELGSPTYGKLKFDPVYAVVSGRAASGSIPHIDVTYKGTSISAASTSNLTSARLIFSDGSSQNVTVSGSTKTSTISGTGSYSSKRIESAYVKSGGNAGVSGTSYGELFSFSSSNLASTLGLSNVTYPYAAGSWTEYIDQVKTTNYYGSYRYMFGYMTLINYWNYQRESYSETKDLWKISQYPLKSLKQSVQVLTDYVTTVEADDQIGLAIYSHTQSPGAILELPLSQNFAAVAATTQQRQAGHYLGGTNMAAGMQVARKHLISNGRPNSVRMMILMTDGLPNLSPTREDATTACYTEANAAKAANIKLMTISLGADADTGLLADLASITNGKHYHVESSISHEDLTQQLQTVFAEIAADRPLKLIQPDGSDK